MVNFEGKIINILSPMRTETWTISSPFFLASLLHKKKKLANKKLRLVRQTELWEWGTRNGGALLFRPRSQGFVSYDPPFCALPSHSSAQHANTNFFNRWYFFLTRQTDVGKKLELLAVRQKLKLCVPHEEWNLRPCGIVVSWLSTTLPQRTHWWTYPV